MKLMYKDPMEICIGCGHEAKSHNGFCWEEDEPTYRHKFKECKCKIFRCSHKTGGKDE